MELCDIPTLTSAGGFTLNIEERAALSASLAILRDSERFHHVRLWGKVLAVSRMYLVAVGWSDDYFRRKYFYSMDASTWLLLPEVTTEEVKATRKISQRFTGDIAFEYTVGDEVASETPDSSPKTVLNEEKRLSAFIRLINNDCEIVPRGAFYKDAMNSVQLNPSFVGLSRPELPHLESYFHFRPDWHPNTALMTTADRDRRQDTIDIFESVSSDRPRGVWSINLESGAQQSVLRNLEWPGYFFFHSTQPSRWGGMYVGTGQRNINFGYML
ncbi:hypothetical protein M427DRAFT_68591 [Gonapodya prolifera JEL478]|uniref:Radial spoke head protein 9 homolog n=1 Tax=Gonapodya prolifera (strain JEL478) TaxID=1344416 RepID=A0A139AK65_GONPJ|nr:hypothetical protein M427DRAFT_68591 [Gonapodya prolifera JEL478]|eukprot:KXS17171.1 hypothetical protein M427DRAFT_68591 [Gonapodya prolifera JEL478]